MTERAVRQLNLLIYAINKIKQYRLDLTFWNVHDFFFLKYNREITGLIKTKCGSDWHPNVLCSVWRLASDILNNSYWKDITLPSMSKEA